jgi:predicted GNAT family acetyltransferase
VGGPGVVGGGGGAARDYAAWLVQVVTVSLLEPTDPATSGPVVRVVHEPDGARYLALVDDRPAGRLTYERTERLVVLTGTEVDPVLEDLPVAAAMVRRALDDVRAEGTTRVLAGSPFVTWWVQCHPEYADLLHGAG